MEGECVRVLDCDCPEILKQKWYGCRKCTRVCPTFEELVIHKEKEHREILDPQDPTRFISLDPLSEHSASSGPDSPSEAEEPLEAQNEECVKKTIKRIRPRCYKCRKRFPHNMAYNKHLSTCQPAQESSEASQQSMSEKNVSKLSHNLTYLTQTCPFCIKPISTKNIRRHTKNSHEIARETLTGVYEVREPVTLSYKKYLEGTFVNSTFSYAFPIVEPEKRKRSDSNSNSSNSQRKKIKTEFHFPPQSSTGIKKEGQEDSTNQTKMSEFWPSSTPGFSSIESQSHGLSDYNNEFGFEMGNFQQLQYPLMSQESELNMSSIEHFSSSAPPDFDQHQAPQSQLQYFEPSAGFQNEFKTELIPNSDNFLPQIPQTSEQQPQQHYQPTQELTDLQTQLIQQEFESPEIPMTFYSAPIEDSFTTLNGLNGTQFNENPGTGNYLQLGPNDPGSSQTTSLLNTLNEFDCPNGGMSLQDISAIFNPSTTRTNNEEKEENNVIVNQMEMEYLDLDIQKNNLPNPMIDLQNDILFSSTIHPDKSRDVKVEDDDCQILSESLNLPPQRNVVMLKPAPFGQQFFAGNSNPNKLNGAFKVVMRKEEVRELSNLHGNSPIPIRLAGDLKATSLILNKSAPTEVKRPARKRTWKPKLVFPTEKDQLAYKKASCDLNIVNSQMKETNTPSSFHTLQSEQKRLKDLIAQLVKLCASHKSSKLPNKSPTKSKSKSSKGHSKDRSRECVSCPKCRETLASAYGLSRHLKIHENPQVFCEFCNQGFPSTSIMIKHMFKVHENDVGLEKLEDVRASLVNPKHNRQIRKDNSRKCPLLSCSRKLSRPDVLKKHVLTHTKGNVIRCINCLAENDTIETANDHHKWCSDKQSCFFCGMILRRYLLVRHISVLHKKAELACAICKDEPKAKFESFMALNEHLLEEHPELKAKKTQVKVSESDVSSSEEEEEEDKGAGFGMKKCCVKITPLKPEDIHKYNLKKTENEREGEDNFIPTLVHVKHEENHEIKMEESEGSFESSEGETEKVKADGMNGRPSSTSQSPSSASTNGKECKVVFSGDVLKKLSRDIKVKSEAGREPSQEQEMTAETSSGDSSEERKFGKEELMELIAKVKVNYDEECQKEGTNARNKRQTSKRPSKSPSISPKKRDQLDEPFSSSHDVSVSSASSSENEAVQVTQGAKRKSNPEPKTKTTRSSDSGDDEEEIEIIGEIKGVKPPKPPLPPKTIQNPGKGNVLVLIKTDPSGVTRATTNSLFLRLGENSDLRNSIVTTKGNLTLAASNSGPICSVSSGISPNVVTRLPLIYARNQAIVRANGESANVQNLISPQFLIKRVSVSQMEQKELGSKMNGNVVNGRKSEESSESPPSSPELIDLESPSKEETSSSSLKNSMKKRLFENEEEKGGQISVQAGESQKKQEMQDEDEDSENTDFEGEENEDD